ncbi:hypothetical protein Terro_0098 [Terriglobus roseus DSM 18391]|uniref:Uncharacterized protein n=1 Tax=Terriglobus roseus (strain DSM 18391 / NRRL B-41598 / KBS 63) TaxID=926566 RepID=I3ZB31_TERRK|nr:hypothetical protein [Terriglobus roseus]AFL86449.1 hypothetical protein Terro_0098 [Terriglobus roseus DSM 18391]
MRQDPVLGVALWLLTVSSSGRDAEAFAGDLLELFHAGCSRWWCLRQALLRSGSVTEQRLRASLVPLCYCAVFVLLHPLWQQLYTPSVAGLLTKYRGAIQWPGSAVLEMIAGLLPAFLFLYVGVFVYSLLRHRSLQSHPVATLLSLNVGACLLFVAMLVRLHVLHNDLRLLSRADFYYPLVHGRFSVLLFLSLFGAVLILPRTDQPRRRKPSHVAMRSMVQRIARRFGSMAPPDVPRAIRRPHETATKSLLLFTMSER